MSSEDSTRDRLVQAAAALLAGAGPEAVTLREVAARVGVSHNTPYRHFRDKVDLLAAVAAMALRDLTERMHTVQAQRRPPVDALRATAETFLDWARESPARFQLSFGPWGALDHAELHAAASGARSTFHGVVETCVIEGVIDGEPDTLVGMVWALTFGAVNLELAGHLQKEPQAPAAEQLLTEFIARLARPTDPDSAGKPTC